MRLENNFINYHHQNFVRTFSECLPSQYIPNNFKYQKNMVLPIFKEKMIICTCSKTNCNKKYCECYKKGINCNSECRCINCKNKKENFMTAKKQQNKKEKTDILLERISVNINKCKMDIKTEKVLVNGQAEEEKEYLNKKRCYISN